MSKSFPTNDVRQLAHMPNFFSFGGNGRGWGFQKLEFGVPKCILCD